MNLLSLRVVPLMLALLQSTVPQVTQAPSANPAEVATPTDAKERIETAVKVNGLAGLNKPWHLKAHFEVLDPDGKQTDSGTYEEWHVSKSEYRIALHSQQVSVDQYGTGHGMFIKGQQAWPMLPLSGIQMMIERPVPPLERNEDRELKNYDRKFGSTPAPCTALMPRGFSIAEKDADSYCFSQANDALLYTSQNQRYIQRVFRQTVSVNGQLLAQQMQLLAAFKPWMNVYVDTIEDLSSSDSGALTVPPDAVPLFLRTGENEAATLKALKKAYPSYPVEAKRKMIQGIVIVDAMIGTDGHVKNAHAIVGPPELQQAALDAANQWRYSPVEINGHAAEQEIQLTLMFRLGN